MKRVLIVICDMRIGGAQRSLLSFLQELCAHGANESYDIQLLPLNPSGEYLKQIPEGIRLRMPDRTLRWLGNRMSSELLLKYFSFRGVLGEALWVLRKALHIGKGNIQQRVWDTWHRMIPDDAGQYDTAIAYIDGIPAYYVLDKVSAKRKVVWLHSDYEKQGYEPAYDRPFFEKCDAVITVSEACREVFCRALPECGHKTYVLENISSSSIIQKSREGTCPEFGTGGGLRLLSVGRLHEQKGMDIAIEAAKRLKDRGVDYRWLIVGEGSERERLEGMIRSLGLESSVKLIGAQDNPYKYMRECDILVQPSRVEGKSIVLDEAKMLNKPIVVTCYPTVADAIDHEQNGLIVDMHPQAVCDGIIRMMEEDELRRRIVERLREEAKGNEEELKRYIGVMLRGEEEDVSGIQHCRTRV